MKLLLTLLIISVCAATGFTQTARSKRLMAAKATNSATATSQADVLPIRRVILYSNGVSYIERRGFVSGNAEVNLSFKQSQVDDVLKSMLVLDLGRGKIGAVSYNSSAPISSRMAEIPFSVNPVSGDGGGISSVLSQLQGAKVFVASTKGSATGSILTIERKFIKTDKETQITSVLVIASESGELFSFDLADVKSVKLIDDGTRRDINEFANATASARRLDAKTITVTSQGTGQREMVVSYTIAAPIWKTTYRVVLDAEGKPFFQGWAIVDNVSEENWESVQMSLVSGSPISFIQNLQKPFYRYRPVVPTPEDLQLQPQVYEPGGSGVGYGSGSGDGDGSSSDSVSGKVVDPNGAVVPGARVTITNSVTGLAYSTTTDSDGDFEQDGLTAGQYNVRVDSPGFKSTVVTAASLGQELQLRLEVGSVSEVVNVSAASISNLPVNGREMTNFMRIAPGVSANNSFIPGETKISDALTGVNSGVTAAAKGEEIGDLFEYRIEQPVTVERNRSALIPIVQTKMDGERTAIYNESTRSDRPYSGILLKNTTNLTLESGSLTVLDNNAYAGEALMERLKPKEQRLISFALDLGTSVVVRNEGNREAAKLVKAVNGVLQVHYFQGEQKTYQITNQTDRKKTVYIEYPIRTGWELSEDSPKPDYTTQRYYRFRLELGPFEDKKIKISVRQPLMDSYQLTTLQKTDLAVFMSRKYIDESTRVRLEKILDIRSQMTEIDRKLATFDDEVDKIEADQKRLRENIESLSKTAEAKTLIARYIAKAGEQETRLEEMEKERKSITADKASLELDLATEIRIFEIR